MQLPKYDITLRTNAKWTLVISNISFSLADYTGKMQIRSIKNSSVLIELSTSNNKIVIDDTAKTITLTITNTEIAAITEKKGIYDLVLIKSSEGTVILEGGVTITSGVTTI